MRLHWQNPGLTGTLGRPGVARASSYSSRAATTPTGAWAEVFIGFAGPAQDASFLDCRTCPCCRVSVENPGSCFSQLLKAAGCAGTSCPLHVGPSRRCFVLTAFWADFAEAESKGMSGYKQALKLDMLPKGALRSDL